MGAGRAHFLGLLLVGLLGLGLGSGGVAAAELRPLTVLLDAGHMPTPKHKRGAISMRGLPEVDYNDHFVAKLAKALQAAGIAVQLTRQPHESLGLMDRADLANRLQPTLFLSIHHDSTQLISLEKIMTEYGETYRTLSKIAGHSIFVSKRNAGFPHAYRFAELLGTSLLTLGRKPTLHHAEAVTGESRELLNRRLGVYRFDHLVVLANTEVPAVLLEIGVIVDTEDERDASNPQNQDVMCPAIVAAVQRFGALP